MQVNQKKKRERKKMVQKGMEAEEIKVIQPKYEVNDRVARRERRGHEGPCRPR